MKTAYYYIHGRGRGHASRSQAIRSALAQADYRSKLFAGGDAMDLLSGSLVEPRPPLARGPTSPLKLVARALQDAAYVQRHRPDLVVSDGDHGAVLGARLAGVTAIAIGHDIVFDPRVSLPDLPKGALRAQRLNALPTRAADHFVGVHFLPARSEYPTITLARPESVAGEVRQDAIDGPIVCYFRDRNGEELLRALVRTGREILLFGPPSPGVPGVLQRPFSRTEFQRALGRCSAVVSSAGSNMLAECVLLKKPMLAVYRSGDAEQCLNAHLVERASVGMGSPLSNAPALAETFAQRVAARDFAQVDLAQSLPPLSVALERTLRAIATNGS